MTVPNSDLRAGPWSLPVTRVANLYLKAQNAAIGATGLVVAPGAGLFRVSLALATEVAGTAGQITASVQSRGDNNIFVVQSLTPINVAGALSIAQDSFVCESDDSSNINYLVTFTGVTVGSLQYTLRAVVEQLSALP